MRKYDVYAVHAEGIALRTGWRLGQTVGSLFVVFTFTLALLEGVEIVEKMVAHFFEIFGDVWTGVFFLEFLDDSIHQDGRSFLLEVAQFAGQFAGKR